jgi:hypothetical protein
VVEELELAVDVVDGNVDVDGKVLVLEETFDGPILAR